MSNVYFKASLQNTLNPEVGIFNNVYNKEGTFTLEDGEYYLTNNTDTSYRVYYPIKDIHSVGFTVEFDVNYSNKNLFNWCLGFNGDDSTYWFGIGVHGLDLEFRGQTLPNYHLITSPNTWLHVKCIFDYDNNQNNVHIYIDNVEVNNFTISKNYGIKHIDILGNSGGFVPNAKIKNIIIYGKKHYLDTTGLTTLWSKIKLLFATKSDLSNYYNKKQIDILLGESSGGTGGDYYTKLTIYDLVPDGAEAHNSIWGGRDITAAFDNGTVSANIANGTFYDIFPGDYITKQVTISGKTYDVTWVVADCDYWINKGDTAMTAHHVVIVPQVPIFNASMNVYNITEGGYAGSEMYKNIIPACATGIVNAFGSDHILTFRDGITNNVNTSLISSNNPYWTGVSGWWGEWVSVQCNLMSEKMVYGAPITASGAMDNTVALRQMSAFRLSEKLINYSRQHWWLRDVVSSPYFAHVSGYGFASANNASVADGVRPFALLI